MSDEKEISQRYRELPREEPPRHLDEAILAASRRAAETRPAPLVVPSGRRRWYFPLAAAAIIVLAVAVTMHVEREQPDAELVVAQKPVQVEKPAAAEPAKPAERPPSARKASPPSKGFVPDPDTAQRDAAATQGGLMAEQRLAEERARQEQQRALARADAERAQSTAKQEAAAASVQSAPPPAAAPARRPASVLAKLAEQSPEQWLQGIADLRRQQRHAEADRELAEFRKRYPGYKIPEAMLEKVEKR